MHSEWKQRVIRNFDVQAKSYAHNCDVQSQIAHRLAEQLPDLHSPHILEIGCGSGALTRLALERYPNGTFDITDLSPNMLRQAKSTVQSAQNIKWRVMDGENPQSDQKYDLIIANMVFQWFEDKDGALSKLQNLLKPRGVLLYSVPSQKSFPEWHETLNGLGLHANTLQGDDWRGALTQESITVDYKTTLNFLRTIKKTGAHTPAQGYKMLRPADLKRACTENDKRHGGKTTWHILYARLSAE